MTRREKIEFLKGLMNGTRSLNELAKESESQGTGTHVLIEYDEKNVFIGNDGKKYKLDEIEKLSGWKVVIKNPHLNAGDQ